MSDLTNPYKAQPQNSFWRTSVGDRHYADISDLWEPMPLELSDSIATAGSCFAQHIGNSLALRGAKFMNLEPAPPLFSDIAEARRWGYGVFSCRYGNIYTCRQLIQLFDEAHGLRKPKEIVWTKNGRYYDALRPGVDPVGQDSPDSVLALRDQHLDAVKKMFAELDVFVFTMGLTEGWELREDGTMFPTAPGTIAGTYDASRYAFHNLNHDEVRSDMLGFWQRLRDVNSRARMLLTVSPVPLAATATKSHVLVATSYSKSILRSVAGELSNEVDGIFYFPSFEIIGSHPARGMFFEPDLRNVNQLGVNIVMDKFFVGKIANVFGVNLNNTKEDIEIICEEAALDT